MSDTSLVQGPATGPTSKQSGDAGQGVVGNQVTSPWVPSHPNAPITQGWGITDYGGEPPGHGSAHWHAGVDLGYPSNTIVTTPLDSEWWNSVPILSALGEAVQQATNTSPLFNAGTFHHGVWNGKSYVPDPGGYGDHAATLTINDNSGNPKFDVILGHGSAYLSADGQTMRPGDSLIKTDCEGNCSGPHLHFEVRPYHGAYGTDVDPWAVLTGGGTLSITGAQQVTGIGNDIQDAANSIAGSIIQVEKDAVQVAAGIGLAAIGIAGLGFAVFLFGREAMSGSAGSAVRSAVPRIPRSGTRHPDARIARARGNQASPVRPQRLRGGEASVTVPRPASTAARPGAAMVRRVDSSRAAARAGVGRPTGLHERLESRMNEAALARGRMIEANRMRQRARGQVPFKDQF